MTHAEKEVRNLEIVQLRHEGKSMSEIAEMYGLTHGTVWHICDRYGVAGKMSDRKGKIKHPRNQYTNGKFDREANIIKCIEERAPSFEYVGGFTNVDGFVDLRCKTCGTVIRKSCVAIRHRHATCDECIRRERDERKRLEQLRKQEEREHQKRDRLLSKKAIQSTFRICPICNNIFMGSNTYCSSKCRENNKWRMKDGYRRMFPLDEVYERDNGICYLCGKACDWNDYKEQDGVIVYGNMYPSRDHIIPKSRGGKNTWSNIRLAHRICNSLKSDSPLVKKMA